MQRVKGPKEWTERKNAGYESLSGSLPEAVGHEPLASWLWGRDSLPEAAYRRFWKKRASCYLDDNKVAKLKILNWCSCLIESYDSAYNQIAKLSFKSFREAFQFKENRLHDENPISDR